MAQIIDYERVEAEEELRERDASNLREQGRHQRQVADDAAMLLPRQRDSVDYNIHLAAELQRKAGSRTARLSDEDYRKQREYISRARALMDQEQMLEAIRDGGNALANKLNERAAQAKEGVSGIFVKDSAGPYGYGSGHSFYRDLIKMHVPESRENPEEFTDASERINRHMLNEEIYHREQTLRALHGTHDRQEQRVGMSTAAASGGSFVTPIYAKEYDVYKSYPASLVEQVSQVPDPGYGFQLNVPVFTSVAQTAQQVELSGVSDSAPGAGYVTAALVPIAGEVIVSQQLFDLAGPDPVEQDKAITQALLDDYRATVDAYVAAQVIAAGGVTDGQASFTLADFFQDCANTMAQVATGAGQKLPATHAFTQPQLMQWLMSQSDENGRPAVLPVPTFGNAAAQYGKDPGFSGYTLLGAALFSDGNIANVAGTNPAQSPIVFANASEVFVLRSTPVLRVIPEEFAPSLSVVVQCYSYVAVIVRHASAVQSLEAAYLLSSPTFN